LMWEYCEPWKWHSGASRLKIWPRRAAAALGVCRFAFGSPPRRLIGHALGLRFLLAGPVRVGTPHRADVRELGAEQKDLGGVVHLQENDRQRAGGAESGSGAALPEVEADQILAY